MKTSISIAQLLVEKLNLKNGFDIITLVKQLGGKVIFVDDIYMDAYLEKDGNGFVIYLDSSKSSKRQRFSIAHELGHLFLHLKYLDQSYWSSLSVESSRVYRYGHDVEELEANEFAAELLMPYNEFSKIVKDYSSNGNINLLLLSEQFNTSVDAVKYRGHNLGFWRM